MANAIQRILSDERAFYDEEPKDRLKVAPFNMVKRIPRDYIGENDDQGN